MNKVELKAWFQASRPPFYIATAIPIMVGWILAAHKTAWHPWRFAIIILGSLIVHLATNLGNDYFDFVQGTDEGEAIGGSRVIQENKISVRAIRNVTIMLYGIAVVIAFLMITYLKIWYLWIPVGFAFFSSIFYVAPPIKYGYRGLGELFVGINMGPLMVAGTYWAIAEKLSWDPIFISIPLGLMVASILYYQNLPDINTDARAGKRTLAVRLGKDKAIIGLILIFLMIYLSIVLLILFHLLPLAADLTLLTIPIFLKLMRHVKSSKDISQLDQYGKYVRIIYFINGIIIILSLLIFHY